MNLKKKVSPLGVAAIVIGAFIVVYLGVSLKVHRPGIVKPPYSQEKLAKVIVKSFSAGNDMQFYAATFSASEIDRFVDLSFYDEEDDHRSSHKEARLELRNHWTKLARESQNAYEDIFARFDEDEAATLEFDSFEIGGEKLDRDSRRIICKDITIFMHSDYNPYRLDIELMIQTIDGWKIAGSMTLTRME